MTDDEFQFCTNSSKPSLLSETASMVYMPALPQSLDQVIGGVEYFLWAQQVIRGLLGVNETLEQHVVEVLDEGRRLLDAPNNL